MNPLHRIVACLLVIAGLAHPAHADLEIVEKAALGDWVILAKVDKVAGEGACAVNRENELGVALGFVAERASGSLYLAILGRQRGWDFAPGTQHEVTYSVDGADPVAVTARAFSADHLSVPLGPEVARSDPLRLGRWIELRTEVGDFRFSLSGSSRALDALIKCAVEHLDFPDPQAAARPDPMLEASIAAAKKLRIMQVVFAHDPSAEFEFRARLGQAASSGDKGLVQREAKAFLAERMRTAFHAAPAEAVARLAQLDLDVLRRLETQPGYCAEYFDASRLKKTLPSYLRAAQSDGIAEVVEAAFMQPVPPSSYGEEQLVSWIAAAYVMLGYPAEDLAKLDNLGELSSREVCRLGTELMTAVVSLGTERAGEVYRWMKLSVLE